MQHIYSLARDFFKVVNGLAVFQCKALIRRADNLSAGKRHLLPGSSAIGAYPLLHAYGSHKALIVGVNKALERLRLLRQLHHIREGELLARTLPVRPKLLNYPQPHYIA